MHLSENNLTVIERNKLWLEQREAKLNEERDRKNSKLERECTFKPKLVISY